MNDLSSLISALAALAFFVGVYRWAEGRWPLPRGLLRWEDPEPAVVDLGKEPGDYIFVASKMLDERTPLCRHCDGDRPFFSLTTRAYLLRQSGLEPVPMGWTLCSSFLGMHRVAVRDSVEIH